MSARFLETIILHEPYRGAQTRHGVRISGAWCEEDLDLSGGDVPRDLWLVDSRFQYLDLSRTKARAHVSLKRTIVHPKLLLNSASIEGSLTLDGGWFNDLEMIGATISDQVDMEGTNVPGTLDMDSATIRGSLILRKGNFRALVLRAANVAQQVLMTDATVQRKLEMNSINVFSSVIMDRLVARDVSLRGAYVKGQLSLAKAQVRSGLGIDAATIDSTLILTDGSFDHANLKFVSVGSNLVMSGSRFAKVDLTGARIAGELRLADHGAVPEWVGSGTLRLRNATAQTLQDAPNAWPKLVKLDGFDYQHLGGSGGGTFVERRIGWFRDWLARTYPYRPQPYEKLASVFRQMGHYPEANDILYAGRERGRDRTWKEDHHFRWLGQSFLKLTIGYGYGYRYFRSLIWVFALVVIGVVVLRVTGQHQVPASDGRPPMTLGAGFALDMLLPIITLRRAHQEVDLDGFARYYFYFHKVMGFLLGSFLVAGLSGLTK